MMHLFAAGLGGLQEVYKGYLRRCGLLILWCNVLKMLAKWLDQLRLFSNLFPITLQIIFERLCVFEPIFTQLVTPFIYLLHKLIGGWSSMWWCTRTIFIVLLMLLIVWLSSCGRCHDCVSINQEKRFVRTHFPQIWTPSQVNSHPMIAQGIGLDIV